MKPKVFFTAVHPNNYTFSAGLSLLQQYGCSDFETAKTIQEADIVLFLEYGYVGVTDLPKLASCIRCSNSAMHFVFSEADWPFPVLTGAYPSLTKPCSWAHGWSFLPRFSVNENSQPSLQEAQPDLFFSFMGRIATHPVRSKILVFDSPKTPCLDTADGASRFHNFDYFNYSKTYVDLIRRSKFVLCPRGFGVSTNRVFETMCLGRVPVIISDQWQKPPGIPWNDCCILVPESNVSHIPNILASFEDRAHSMGRLARCIYEENFGPKVFFDRLLMTLLKEYSVCSFTLEALCGRACRAAGWRELRTLLHQARSAIVGR
jgi:hypothetical protein